MKDAAERFLIVGGDSGIGRALSPAIAALGKDVLGTSRKGSAGNRFLDLADMPGKPEFAGDFSCAFICAARSGFADCEQNPRDTFRVNVEGALAAARALLGKGCFVVFLSSSAVFDGSAPWPNEYSEPHPTTEYGRQKAAAERLLAELDREHVAIVRLTKVLTISTPAIARFSECIRSGSAFEAFSDLKLSPISMPYVVQSLLSIAAMKTGGIFHLSGEAELSYAEFAEKMASGIGAEPGLVRKADSSGLQIHFRPQFPGLGMTRTAQAIGLKPEPIGLMIERLLAGHQKPRQ